MKVVYRGKVVDTGKWANVKPAIRAQLEVLDRHGRYEELKRWFALRVQDYGIQFDVQGRFGYDDEIIPQNKVVSMLKFDFRRAAERGEWPPLTDAALSFAVAQALTRLIELANEEFTKLPEGHHER